MGFNLQARPKRGKRGFGGFKGLGFLFFWVLGLGFFLGFNLQARPKRANGGFGGFKAWFFFGFWVFQVLARRRCQRGAKGLWVFKGLGFFWVFWVLGLGFRLRFGFSGEGPRGVEELQA